MSRLICGDCMSPFDDDGDCKCPKSSAPDYMRPYTQAELDAAVRAAYEDACLTARMLAHHENAHKPTAEMIAAAIRERGK